jgi:hypothetical protein
VAELESDLQVQGKAITFFLGLEFYYEWVELSRKKYINMLSDNIMSFDNILSDNIMLLTDNMISDDNW